MSNNLKDEIGCIKNIKEIQNHNKVLIMPVGIGDGSDNQIEGLAHGLQYLISKMNPNLVIFLGSEESKKTIKSIKKQYLEEFEEKHLNTKKQFKQCIFIQLNDVDNFDECFTKFSQAIEYFEKSNIIVDYTSGTRTMSVAAAISGIINKRQLVFVGGNRGKHFIVDKGNENRLEPELKKVYSEQAFQSVMDYFNNYRFKTAQDNLSQIETEDNNNLSILSIEKNYKIKLLKTLIDTYYEWDRFDHNKAYKSFIKFNELLDEAMEKEQEERISNLFKKMKIHESNNKIENGLYNNYFALKTIQTTSSIFTKEKYLLASLINNASRRAEEGFYDDAIARLYRATEFIAQIRLENTYHINYNTIPKKKYDELKLKDKDLKLFDLKNGNYKLFGLKKTYHVLNLCGKHDSIWSYYDKSNIQKSIEARNNSVLAHDLKHKTLREYESFYENVCELFEKLDKNYETYITNTKFPKFK